MKDIRKILIIRFSSLGDIVLTFPLIKILKQTLPDSEINFLVKEKYSEILKLNPDIDRILILNKKLSVTANEISSSEYDLILDLQKNFKSRLVSFGKGKTLKRVKKESIRKLLLVWFKWSFFREIIPVYKKYINTAEGIINIAKTGFTTADLKFSKEKIFDGRYIVISPSSKHFTKTYPAERFINFIKSVKDVKIVLTGDDSDRDVSICGYLENECPGIINMCGKLNMKSLLNVLFNSEYVICNDSAVLHLSEALGKKVIVLFGSTVKEFGFFPQLDTSEVFENNNLNCRPCTHIGKDKCPRKHFLCMDYEIRIN